MKNKMSDLRNHLFETLEALKDDEKPMEIGRARAVCEVAQALINTAKVEIDLIKAVGSGQAEQSGFFAAEHPALPPAEDKLLTIGKRRERS